MSVTISNVTIDFPSGFANYSTQTLAVACAISGLADGVTPSVTFPCLEISTAMTSTGKGTWAASNTDIYAAEAYSITIQGTPVTFSVGDTGVISNIVIG
jgi:hypothetical protein